MSIDVPATLAYLRPGEAWRLDGEGYDGLTWLAATTKPTVAEIVAAWDAVQAQRAAAAQTAATAASNRTTLEQQALAAFNTNRAAITRNTASVAVANPTNAQVIAALKDALRQLSDLERQNNAIMRILLGLLDGVD